jgi:tetratricopeptide (TPR) repeat protein
MKMESVVYALAGVCFGLITGWIISSQQSAADRARFAMLADSAAASSETAPAENSGNTPAPAILDESKVQALQNVAEKDPKNANARTELGNLYYDSARYTEAIKWYAESLALNPKNAEVSTDLGVSYYYNNEIDKAIQQLNRSLEIDPAHAKTMLNLGVVLAFGKQDLKGATDVWKRLVEIAPQSPEGQQAKQALDSLSTAHGATSQ